MRRREGARRQEDRMEVEERRNGRQIKNRKKGEIRRLNLFVIFLRQIKAFI